MGVWLREECDDDDDDDGDDDDDDIDDDDDDIDDDDDDDDDDNSEEEEEEEEEEDRFKWGWPSMKTEIVGSARTTELRYETCVVGHGDSKPCPP